MPAGGGGTGSEKMVPICACAGGTKEKPEASASAASAAVNPLKALVRNIVCRFNRRIGLQGPKHYRGTIFYRRLPPNPPRLTRRLRRVRDSKEKCCNFRAALGTCSPFDQS